MIEEVRIPDDESLYAVIGPLQTERRDLQNLTNLFLHYYEMKLGFPLQKGTYLRHGIPLKEWYDGDDPLDEMTGQQH